MSQYEENLNNDLLEIDIRKLMASLWKKMWLILLVAATLGSAMFLCGKATYVPAYKATSILYATYVTNQNVSIDEKDVLISEQSLSSSRNLVETCLALLDTRMTLEQVAAAANTDISYTKLSKMISAEAVGKTEIFKLSVTGENPEEAALIANTTAEILAENVAVVSSGTVGVIDTALVPTAPVRNNIVRNAALAAILGAVLVCGIIVVKEIHADWKLAEKKRCIKADS